MRLKGHLYVVGKAGPFDVDTEEAVRGLHEKLEAAIAKARVEGGPLVPLRVGGELVLATCTAADVVQQLGGGYAVEVEVEVDDAAVAGAMPDAPPGVPTADESAELERILEERGL